MAEDAEVDEEELVDLGEPDCFDDSVRCLQASDPVPKSSGISVCDSCARSHEKIRNLEEQLELLTRKNDELKRCLRLVDWDRLYGFEGPDIQVIFMNTDASRRHRHKIEDLLANVMQSEAIAKKEPLPKPIVRTSAPRLPKLDDDCDELSDSEKKTRIIVGCMQFQKDFLVDRVGWPLINYDIPPCHTPGWPAIPFYIQVFSAPLPVDTDDSSNSSASASSSSGPMPSRVSCFNCEGSHTMSDCKLPRDEMRIRRNRLEAQKNRLVYKRYHVSEAKYGHLEPGRMSGQLLQALGLPADGSCLPAHVYCMRRLGYPPGWRLEAERSDSGLAMFDKHGREITLDGDNMDEEVYPANPLLPREPSIDPMKLIDYPGFNAKMPETVTFDDYKAQGVPPLAWERERSLLHQRSLAGNSDSTGVAGSKRPGNGGTEPHEVKRRRSASNSRDVHDMDIATDDNDDKPVALRVGDANDAAPGTTSESPALDECSTAALERRRQELLKQLDRVETVSSESDDAQVLEGSAGELEDEQLAADDSTAVPPMADQQTALVAEDDLSQQKPGGDIGMPSEGATSSADTSTPQRSSLSISVQTGTPVPAISEFTRLPNYENFRTGIEDHIPYENLPDATGTYERMSAVLRKVRQNIPKRSAKKK